jgi:hypothetical protein
MNKERIVLIVVFLILPLVAGPSLPLFKDRFSYAQLIQDSASVSQQQRLGTSNILALPDNVSLVYSNHKNSSLDGQFILLGNNTNRQNVAISNPDYGLSTPIPTLMIGENFNMNSSTDADIVYTSATVKLVPITSPFPPTIMRIQNVDPENDILLGTPITLGNYTGNSGNFVIPHTASSGYYILYVYFYYPTYNLTAVYHTAVQLEGSSVGTRP